MSAGERLKEFVQYSELKQAAFHIATLQRQHAFHSLAVLSFFPGEGKTLFCAAVAMAYADTCRSRVLIIDATTLQNHGSLELRDCFTPPSSSVDLLTMVDIRKGTHFTPASKPEPGRAEDAPETIHEPEIMTKSQTRTIPGRESDQALIRRATQEGAKSHGLVLLDTAPLNSRNKSNVDPFVAARQSDASLLIVSRKFLDATDLDACLKIARDPTLRLIGVMANEEFQS